VSTVAGGAVLGSAAGAGAALFPALADGFEHATTIARAPVNTISRFILIMPAGNISQCGHLRRVL
jgi:hypothetical protein